VQDTITAARRIQNQRKTSLAVRFLFGIIFHKRIVGKQVLIDPVLGIPRPRNIGVDVGGISRVGIRRRFDGANLFSSNREFGYRDCRRRWWNSDRWRLFDRRNIQDKG
jgi:hypothetical protein